MSAALALTTLTIADIFQPCTRRRLSLVRLPIDLASRMLLAPRKLSNETSLNSPSSHHSPQQSKEQDLNQARACPSILWCDGSDEAQVLSQRTSSSSSSSSSSSGSSPLTSLSASEPTGDAQPIGPYSFSDKYNYIRTLDYCSEGPVHVGEHRVDGKLYVIKQVPVRKGGNSEIAILQRIQKHPNIMELADTLQGYTANEPITDDIVTPFAELGDLSDVIIRLSRSYSCAPRAFVLHFVASMIDALAYLHYGDVSYDARTGKTTSVGNRQPSIIHRDIKPGNIFMTATSTTPGLPRIILADFGLSCTADDNFGVVGTQTFQAPEILDALTGNADRQDICTKAGDMYAFGKSLGYLIFGSSIHPMDITDRFCSSNVKDDIEIHDLLKACLAHDPAARPTANSLHALSAKIKAELDTWSADGGRLPESMWTDSSRFSRLRALMY